MAKSELLYDDFEIMAVAVRYDASSTSTYCEPITNDEDLPLPEDPNETGYLEKIDALRVFWTIYGHVDGRGVEAFIDIADRERAGKVSEFLLNLLQARKLLPKLVKELENLSYDAAFEHGEDHREGFTDYGYEVGGDCPACKYYDRVRSLLKEARKELGEHDNTV